MNEIKLSEMAFNPRDCFQSVHCHLVLKGLHPKIYTTSQIELDSLNKFRIFGSDKESFLFSIDSMDYAKRIMADIERGYRFIAQVIAVGDQEHPDIFVLYMVKLVHYKKFPGLKIIVPENIFKKMKDNRLVARNAESFESIQERTKLFSPQGIDNKFYFSYYVVNDKEDSDDAASDGLKENVDSTGIELQEGSEKNVNISVSTNDVATTKWLLAVVKHQLKPEKRIGILGVGGEGSCFILLVGIYKLENPTTQSDEFCMLANELRLKRKIKTQFNPCMRLGLGALSFTSELETSSALLHQMMDTEDAYLKIWKQYIRMEKELNFQKAQFIGELHYENPSPTENRKKEENKDWYILIIKSSKKEVLKELKEGDTLCLGNDLPAYLKDENMTVDEYEEQLQDKDFRKKEFALIKSKCFIEKINLEANMLTISVDPGVVIEGKLYYKNIGDESQIRRKEEAQQKIATGTSANPRLGIIIGVGENNLDAAEIFGDRRAQSEIPARSALVDEKIFKHPPTKIQEKAISIALNTPDIAIIQGPPGTGKTTVITAIVERLNEISDKAKATPGQVLITSLQHDAVHNVIKRLQINSLPTIKFGKRLKDEGTLQDEVDTWRMKLADDIAASSPAFKETEQEQKVFQAYSIYTLQPNKKNARHYLEIARPYATKNKLSQQCDSLWQKYASHQDREMSDLLPAIYRLRTTKRSFADDGRIAARKLYALLDDMDFADLSDKHKEIMNVLRSVAIRQTEWTAELKKQLEDCKNSLLALCIPQPFYEYDSLDEEIVDFNQQLRESMRNPQNSIDKVIYDFWHELDENSYYVNRSIANYAFPYAATAQQSKGKDLQEVKGKEPSYDSVIVDEAARVSPPDLLIPLAQARNRIILVGDHRQLPHMYDPEIFEKLVESGENIDFLDIKTSLFECFVDRAKKLEAIDHRHRFITLDTQYRMHPLLGDFVSDNFYANYGEQFGSGLGEEFFHQPFEREPVLWINVPGRGMKKANDGSKYRDSEINAIVKRIKKYMDIICSPEASEEIQKMQIGVISFYGAQVRRLKEELKRAGYADALSSGKIRVGTVDSFQGMEFDVVFLSVVRDSILLKKNKRDLKDYKQEELDSIARKSYGFLTVENRLCVAMSRQKRLLVVVGNEKLFNGGTEALLASRYIPALKNFYELCVQKGMVDLG